MGSWSESFLWASMFWGAIAGGYVVYGWKQRSMIPFVAGLVMSVVACFVSSALLMSLICIAMIFGAWWLIRQGY